MKLSGTIDMKYVNTHISYQKEIPDGLKRYMWDSKLEKLLEENKRGYVCISGVGNAFLRHKTNRSHKGEDWEI